MRLFNHWQLRDWYTKKYSWTRWNEDILNIFKKYADRPIYDVMAGTGYWVSLLNEAGIEAYASDLNITNNNWGHKYKHCDIYEADALDVLQRFNYDCDIILSWPGYGDTIGYKIVSSLKPGCKIFFAGEGRGGCTGTDEMYDVLDDCKILDECQVKQWPGLNDYFCLYQK